MGRAGRGGRVGAGGRVIPCALVAYPTIWPLDTAVAAAEVREVVAPTPIGEYVFRARYHGRGRPVPLADYRAGIRDRRF
ncbi:hypothetical protein [Nocardiopsis protaetiae]|uniref:hypothetical protein n=1 Tax=Nocardiopsis protaetiae TaxID=3382270 RepID=UPI00387B7446